MEHLKMLETLRLHEENEAKAYAANPYGWSLAIAKTHAEKAAALTYAIDVLKTAQALVPHIGWALDGDVNPFVWSDEVRKVGESFIALVKGEK